MSSSNLLNENIKKHLEKLSQSMSSQNGLISFDLLAEGWLKKEKVFIDQVKAFGMSEELTVSKGEKKSILILTYSGSLLAVGPAGLTGKRSVIYASVGMRTDVPEQLIEESMSLSSSIEQGKELTFKGGSLQKSSPIYKIALMTENLSKREQTRQLEDATRIMTKEFVSINNTIVPQ